jgi:thymidine phosphorylase
MLDWVGAQGGDVGVLLDPSRLPTARHTLAVLAPRDGYITATDAEAIGLVASMLGAGRTVKEDVLDFSAGLLMHRTVGDRVTAGEPIATLLTSTREEALPAAAERLLAAVTVHDLPPAKEQGILLDIID